MDKVWISTCLLPNQVQGGIFLWTNSGHGLTVDNVCISACFLPNLVNVKKFYGQRLDIDRPWEPRASHVRAPGERKVSVGRVSSWYMGWIVK